MYTGGKNEVVSKGEWGIGLPSIVLKRGGVVRLGITGGNMGILPEVTIENKIEQIRIAICCNILITIMIIMNVYYLFVICTCLLLCFVT